MPQPEQADKSRHNITTSSPIASEQLYKPASLAVRFPACLIAATALFLGTGVTSATGVSGKASGSFASHSLDGWSERSFNGNTQYKLINEGELRVLRGHTQGNASILYREQKVDLTRTPIIHWSWKVDRTYRDIDEQAREGDDFPARLYVVAQIGFLPWQTVAINYVWASETDKGESWTNPFTDNAKMIAVQSGDTHAGNWTVQSRNVVEDFRKYFDRDITELSGFAVMVDGDNGNREATAWFGGIDFSNN